MINGKKIRTPDILVPNFIFRKNEEVNVTPWALPFFPPAWTNRKTNVPRILSIHRIVGPKATLRTRLANHRWRPLLYPIPTWRSDRRSRSRALGPHDITSTICWRHPARDRKSKFIQKSPSRDRTRAHGAHLAAYASLWPSLLQEEEELSL